MVDDKVAFCKDLPHTWNRSIYSIDNNGEEFKTDNAIINLGRANGSQLN